MSHNEIYQMFTLYFPDYAKDRVKEWFPNGKSSVRIRQKNEQEFVFTYLSKTDWRFETIDSYIKGILMKDRKGDTKTLCWIS